MPFIKKKTS